MTMQTLSHRDVAGAAVTSENRGDGDSIAICGLGLRLPGGVRDGDSFWELLVNGKDARGPVPTSRYNVNGFNDSLGGQTCVKPHQGYFLDEDLSCLDTSFFSMTKSEVERCDPQQRQLLEVTRECLDDAGETNYRGQPVGCYVGTFSQDWFEITARDMQATATYSATGFINAILANRVSYEFDLRGPSLVVETACSSSLVALHEACRALQAGDISAAVVGGTSMILGPTQSELLTREGVLSPDGSCKTFDKSANGYARAEGIAAIYIKRLRDAIRDGNPVRAIIRGTASNSNGKIQGLTNPSGEAQEALIRTVYQKSGLDPTETAFFECHGTGTATGDPIEATAIGEIFGEKGVYIGSVKPNVGHSEGCSGLTSLIKCVLALEKKTIPPNIKFETPNPRIPFEEKKLTVPIQPTSFPTQRAERVSINCFGIGGANAHVILESFWQYMHAAVTFNSGVHANGTSKNGVLTNGDSPNCTNGSVQRGSCSGKNDHLQNGSRHDANGIGQYNGLVKGTSANGMAINDLKVWTLTDDGPQLMLFSANTEASLKAQIERYRDYIQGHGPLARDIAYTLAEKRERLPHRAFAVWQDGRIVETSGLVKTKPQPSPQVVMVFSGQGAQWARMGIELVETNHDFHQDLLEMDTILQKLHHPPSWSILEELENPARSSRINSAELAQPICTALQIALVNQLRRLGITPFAVVGHSSGEIAAAYASGYISLEFAMIAAYYRGYVTTVAKPGAGVMAAVALGPREVTPFLRAGVVVACENSPTSTTISGDSEVVKEVLASVRENCPETATRLLVVDMAYHSHHMSILRDSYLDLMRAESVITTSPDKSAGSRPIFISSVTCKSMSDASQFSPEYWVENLVSPVRFSTVVSRILADAGDQTHLFLEVGPHSALAGPLRETCVTASKPYNYISCQRRGQNSSTSLLSSLGTLYQSNIPLTLRPLFGKGRKTLAGLPTYPWDYSASFWYESRLSSAWRSHKYPDHSLLGIRCLESTDTEPLWRKLLQVEHVPWLADHKVRSDIVFPFAAYVAMAGEAVRQTTGVETGYRLRHVVAKTAMVLSEARPAEIVTSLRPRRLTDTEDSAWFDFVISSFNGSAWVKHCEGQVMPVEDGNVKPTRSRDDIDFPRGMTKERFYEAMARVGFVYGPAFQTLSDIRSCTSSPEKISRSQLAETHNRVFFHMHPAAIDGCIQLMLAAESQGFCRNLTRLMVPTVVEDIQVFRGAPESDTIQAMASGLTTAECTADGKVRLRMVGLQLTPLDSDVPNAEEDVHAAAHLQWLPDFDFADVSALIEPPPAGDRPLRVLRETFCFLCILDTAEKVTDLSPCQPHFAKYRDWLHLQIEQAKAGDYALVDQASEHTALDPVQLHQLMEDTFTKILNHPGNHAGILGIKRICDNAAPLFTGELDTLDVLTRDNLLTEIYNAGSFDAGALMRLLSHSRPHLRILEVGAGTGGTTELTLRQLVDEVSGVPLYSSYMFTDISAGFFAKAKERFAYAANVDFQVLDIARDPAEQGFRLGSYDVVLAANVVHATPSLEDSLRNVRALLKPDGMLLLTEITTTSRTISYIYGNFSGWWLGEADDRVWEPNVSPERWDRDLKAAGFDGVGTLVDDEKIPYRLYSTMIAKPRQDIPEKPPRSVTLLCEDTHGELAESLMTYLECNGFVVTRCELSTQLPPDDHDIIACVDLERTTPGEDMVEADFTAFKSLVGSFKSQKLLWLTRPFQVNCRNPAFAQSLGLARSVRAELALPIFTLEIDEAEPEFASLVCQVFEKIRRAEDDDRFNSDKEFAVVDGAICVGRYHPFNLKKSLTSGHDVSQSGGRFKALTIDTPGSLDSLCWKDRDVPHASDMPDDYVQIETRAAGINFKDVLLSMGIVRPPPGTGINLGLEASGVVTRVGPAVQHLGVGARVMALATTGSLATSFIAPASLVVGIPETMSFEEAATIPVCFFTVMRSLLDIRRLQKGQRVLIHSACGATGLAAIQICKMVEAEIFATVGNDTKVRHLVENHGIPSHHIFNSRSSAFLDDVMRETGGRGVDLVLNSLSGDLLHASWKCVAEFGTLVELGQRDSVGSGRLDMSPFVANRCYAAVEVHRLAIQRPQELLGNLKRFVEEYQKGNLGPIQPFKVFPAEEADQAFRYLQNGDHIGKVVVSMPTDASLIKSSPQPRTIRFDPAATYLLVAGAGGLGASIATWLVERGARNLVILSRSTGVSQDSIDLIRELEAMGCSVTPVQGSVDEIQDVERAVKAARSPIRGVFQLAMVLRDNSLINMPWSDWTAVTRPKVQGTWNLHNILVGQPLDYFWMASSIVTVYDQAGQANYVSACTFLDAFCQYRRSLGLPASVLNISAIDGIGYVAENAKARRALQMTGAYFLGEREFLDFVELCLLDSKPGRDERLSQGAMSAWSSKGQVVMGLRSEQDLNEANNTVNWRRDRRMALYHNLRYGETSQEHATESTGLKAFLGRVAAGKGRDAGLLDQQESIEFIATQIGKKIYDLMLKPDEAVVDTSLGLAQIGLDSLMAIELRRWMRQMFGLSVSILEMMACGSLGQLGGLVAGRLREKLQGV